MPIEGYKARWGNARRWGYANTAATSERPMSHVSQRNARSHGSVTRGLVFQKRAMTASTPIVTNGSAAEIANNPNSPLYAEIGLTTKDGTDRCRKQALSLRIPAMSVIAIFRQPADSFRLADNIRNPGHHFPRTPFALALIAPWAKLPRGRQRKAAQTSG
jgi:hypothetical protein